ncbi:ABC transporter permease [Sporomusa acidovorans]|uniref:ABC transporter permease n=1 Tax=Sporomusa acidovorans (strain ATCC 49682 / DSM 3132 / Mol) TaxID=1123286 RepID=A0ABZ3IWT9_SPOA4|nr:ABC transporter permease [Sporomusa acidovorans]OZC23377.1 FtsX-like permease family protein [Sporomusa acidovorans DSM 3132]SDE43512.1 putative ABC transport system permease protein [Sporomusa acidovorans]
MTVFQMIGSNLLHRKLQNSILILMIVLGVAIAFAASALYKSADTGMNEAIKRMGADIVIVPNTAEVEGGTLLYGGAPVNVYMNQSKLDEIKTIPGFISVSPQFFVHTLSGADCCSIDIPTRVIGIDPATDTYIKPWLPEAYNGRLPENSVILGAKNDYAGEPQIKILGKIFDIAAVAGETGTSIDYSIYMNINTARQLVKDNDEFRSMWAKYGQPENLISVILVRVEESADINFINEYLAKTGSIKPIIAVDVKKSIQSQMQLLMQIIGTFCFAIIGTIILQIFSNFYLSMRHRRSEYGTYLALGASRCKIYTLVVGEAISISVVGGFSGLLAGMLLYRGSCSFLSALRSYPLVSLSGRELFISAAIVFIVGVLVTTAASILPAWQAARLDPSSVMTKGEYA